MRPRHLVLVLAAALILWNLGGAHDLWAPDEPYFAEGAREMVVDGEWWVPHVNGVVSTDKPPLFFWTIALASLAAGSVSPLTARLPSALAALATLLLVLRIGRRLGSERAAWLAVLILATMVMFWEKARWAQTDALLCFLVWVALAAFEAWRAGDADGRRAGLLFWLAAALAVLTKGPVGLLLPLGIALATLAFDRRLPDWRRFAPAAGPLSFGLVVGAWMLAAGADADYSVWGALREHFVDRAVHGLHHRQPPWYFLEVLPAHLLPWSGLIPGALLLAWRRRSNADRFLLTAALFVVVFFSISTEKRHLYALPAVPALALLAGRLVDRLEGAAREAAAVSVGRRWVLAGNGVVAGLLLLSGLALPFVARRYDEVPAWIAAAVGLILAATGIATLVACRRSRVLGSTLALAAGISAFYLFAVTAVYPLLDPHKSARAFSLRLESLTSASRAAGRPVLAYDLSNLPEAFAFYSDGVYTVETHDPARLAAHLGQEGEAWAALQREDLAELPAPVGERIIVAHSDELSQDDVVLVCNCAAPGPPREP